MYVHNGFSVESQDFPGFPWVRKICLKEMCYVQRGQGLELAMKIHGSTVHWFEPVKIVEPNI
jgi:hypothetical protein